MPYKVDDLKATFKKWDADGSGTISKDELFAVFKALDPSFMTIELDEIMSEADVNRDGQIDVDEFITWLSGGKGQGGENMGPTMSIFQGEIWEQKLMQSKSEAIKEYPKRRKKIEEHFDQMKERLSSDDFISNVVSMFLEMTDANEDGIISYDEAKDHIEPTLERLHTDDSRYKSRKLEEAEIKAAFDAHDTMAEGKGKLGKEEFANLVRYLQVIDTSNEWLEQ